MTENEVLPQCVEHLASYRQIGVVKEPQLKKKLCSFPGKLPCKSCEAIECSLLWCLQVERNECRQESFCLLRLRPFLSVSRYSHPKWPIEFCCLKSEFWLGNRYSNIQTGAVQEKLKNGKINLMKFLQDNGIYIQYRKFKIFNWIVRICYRIFSFSDCDATFATWQGWLLGRDWGLISW